MDNFTELLKLLTKLTCCCSFLSFQFLRCRDSTWKTPLRNLQNKIVEHLRLEIFQCFSEEKHYCIDEREEKHNFSFPRQPRFSLRRTPDVEVFLLVAACRRYTYLLKLKTCLSVISPCFASPLYQQEGKLSFNVSETLLFIFSKRYIHNSDILLYSSPQS